MKRRRVTGNVIRGLLLAGFLLAVFWGIRNDAQSPRSVQLPLQALVRQPSFQSTGGQNRDQSPLPRPGVIEISTPPVPPEDVRTPGENRELESGDSQVYSQIQTEALARIGAREYHAMGYKGRGVKIAVIDDQYEGLEERIAEGELPGDIVTRAFSSNGTTMDAVKAENGPHGVACAQIIHDIAPEAQLYLIQVTDLPNTIEAVFDYLHKEGIQIVSMSLSTFSQGRGDGRGILGSAPVYRYLDRARYQQNILVIKSAGNYGRQHYSGQFTDLDQDGWHEFAQAIDIAPWRVDSDEDIPLNLEKGDEVLLHLSWDDWGDDPQHPSATHDYGIIVTNHDGDVVAQSMEVQTGDQAPVDTLRISASEAETYHIRIKKNGDFQSSHQLQLFVKGELTAFSKYQVKSSSLGAPADSPSVLAVGAASIANERLISYSSQGPTADQRIKPDVTSYTNVSVAASDRSVNIFTGTSAAAPHVAGMAALLLNKPVNGNLNAEELEKELLSFVLDRGEPGKDSQWGIGIAQLPPLATTVDILSPTQQTPETDPFKITVRAVVQRSDGTHLIGLNKDAFSVEIGEQMAEVLSVRTIDNITVLEVKSPEPTSNNGDLDQQQALNLELSVLESSDIVTSAVHISGTPQEQRDALPNLNVLMDSTTHQTGDPIQLLVSLLDSAPLSSAWVHATLQYPDPETTGRDTLTLYDDGMHGDGLADDGIYGGHTLHTRNPGVYTFSINASGTTQQGIPFEKTLTISTTVTVNQTDSDGDGIPDNWEATTGLNNRINDAYRDSDMDGLLNLYEFHHGTDPLNWDTDDDTLRDGDEVSAYYATNPAQADTDLGGAIDAIELVRGTNPLDPRDDVRSGPTAYLPLTLRPYIPKPNLINRAVAENDTLWIATSGGVVQYNRQSRRYVKYTTRNGLADNRVYAIAIEADGRKWFGTHNGVSIFDGSTWRTLNTTDGLAHHTVRAIVIDTMGDMWFGTPAGISRLRHGNWSNLTTDHGLVNNDVYAITTDDKGHLWIGTANGVSRYTPGQPQTSAWMTLTTEDGLAHNWVTAIAIDDTGKVWFGTWGAGISEFNAYPSQETPDAPVNRWATLTAVKGFGSNYITDIHVDEAGRKWVATQVGTSMFDGNVWHAYTADNSEAYGLAKGTLYAVTTNTQGRKWLNTQAAQELPDTIRVTMPELGYEWFGLYRQTSNEDEWLTYATEAIEAEPDNTHAMEPPAPVYAICIDAVERKWLGTAQGVSVLHHNTQVNSDTTEPSSWISYRPSAIPGYNRIQDIESVGASVGALEGIGSHQVWISTNGGGVHRFDIMAPESEDTRADDNPWTTYTAANGLVSAYVNSIAAEANGAIWFGSGDGHGGVSKYENDVWRTYTVRDGLASYYVHAIAIDALGRKWFGTENGVTMYDNESWVTYTQEDGLADNHVWDIMVDAKGNLWFGTSNGISVFDGQTIWTTYTTEDGLGANHVTSLALDNRGPNTAGGLWFGTAGGGVSHFSDGQWRTLTTDDGLGNNTVWDIAIDGAGNVWFATDAGVSVLIADK